RALEVEGLAYPRSTYYRDLHDLDEFTVGIGLPGAEDQPPRVGVFHEQAFHPYRYDIEMGWRDPRGEMVDAEGERWHIEGTSVWTDMPETYQDVIGTVEDRYEARRMRSPREKQEVYDERGMPDTILVGGFHVYEKDMPTGRPFFPY
ncbi:unnamed protein product, partial [marine sediment metagenome]